MTTIYYNPACSKCRQTLQLLRERQMECEVVEYLKTPTSRAALERILGMLKSEPTALVRRDKRFQELGLRDEDYSTSTQVTDLLLAHPELMERPIVVHDGRAVIARPPERVLEIL